MVYSGKLSQCEGRGPDLMASVATVVDLPDPCNLELWGDIWDRSAQTPADDVPTGSSSHMPEEMEIVSQQLMPGPDRHNNTKPGHSHAHPRIYLSPRVAGDHHLKTNTNMVNQPLPNLPPLPQA
jgi:hypothetical protein